MEPLGPGDISQSEFKASRPGEWTFVKGGNTMQPNRIRPSSGQSLKTRWMLTGVIEIDNDCGAQTRTMHITPMILAGCQCLRMIHPKHLGSDNHYHHRPSTSITISHTPASLTFVPNESLSHAKHYVLPCPPSTTVEYLRIVHDQA